MSKMPKKNENGEYVGVIYQYKNKTTGKIYVGETDNEDERRKKWNSTANKRYGGNKINAARKEYGVRAWDYEVLETIVNKSHIALRKRLKEREEFWIREKDSVENGYNSSYGSGMQGRKHTPESREKISKNHRHYQTQEAKEKIRKASKGKKMPEETRKKISESNKGKVRSKEHCKAISKAKKGKVPIAAKNGADRWRKENGGGYWKGKTMSVEAKAKMKAVQQKKGTKCIATFPDGHEEFFPTMNDAAKATGINVGSVAYAIETGGTTKKGFKFKKI